MFVGRTPGKIVPARGPPDFGWDPIFEAEGFGQTYAEMDKTIKNTISHRWGFNTLVLRLLMSAGLSDPHSCKHMLKIYSHNMHDLTSH